MDELIDGCSFIESTISNLMERTAEMRNETNQVQSGILLDAYHHIDQLVERERNLRIELTQLKTRKIGLETNCEQYNIVNDKLRELTKINVKENTDQSEIHQATEEFENLKTAFEKSCKEFNDLNRQSIDIKNEVERFVDESKNLCVKIHKDESVIRILQQQNKYSEQHFDLIINLLPWVPLTKECINELRAINNETISNIATVLEVQTNEINELKEALDAKRYRKLEVLEQLSYQLNNFVRKREEAIMVGGGGGDVHK